VAEWLLASLEYPPGELCEVREFQKARGSVKILYQLELLHQKLSLASDRSRGSLGNNNKQFSQVEATDTQLISFAGSFTTLLLLSFIFIVDVIIRDRYVYVV
jgi:hypothetical protein